MLSTTIALSQTLVRIADKLRTASDTALSNEGLNVTKIVGTLKQRFITDTTLKTEFVQRIKTTIRIASDTTAITDPILRLVSAKRILSHTAATSESLTRNVTIISHFLRQITDTVTKSESITIKFKLIRIPIENVIVADTLVKIARHIRLLSDTTTVAAGSLLTIKLRLRQLLDSRLVTESLVKIRIVVRLPAADSIAKSESLQRRVLHIRLLSEPIIQATETIVTHKIFGVIKRILSDPLITSSQLLTRHLFLIREIVDDIGGGIRYIYHISDTVLASDSLFARAIRASKESLRTTGWPDWRRQGREVEAIIRPPKPLAISDRTKIVRRWTFDYVAVQEHTVTKVSKTRIAVITKTLEASSTRPALDIAQAIAQHNQQKARKLNKLYKLLSIIDMIKNME